MFFVYFEFFYSIKGAAVNQITNRSIESLIPYVNNARTHSDEQVAMIAASLREFGWTNPILIDSEGGVIAGHGRLLAARKILDAGASIPNWPNAAEVPVLELLHMTDAQKRAYVIADNKLAERAGWDTELLCLELGGLRDDGFDLGLIGFDQFAAKPRPLGRGGCQWTLILVL